MLMEVLRLKGFNVIPFSYPEIPNVIRMRHALESLAEELGTNLDAAERVRRELAPSRDLAHELDELTWREGVISGGENHLWLVASSDFAGDYCQYHRQLKGVLTEAKGRKPYPETMLRLAYLGVPSVFAEELYPELEHNGARVVFNEIQRQFAMPHPGSSLAEQYCHYTYPYSISHRLSDIVPELERRRVDGVIHYVQAFCHRGIGDIVLRHHIDLPMLTIEGVTDFTLTHPMRTRLEAFLDMIKRCSRSKINL
jgi:benzoyl-CoA reductase/2-hydroxyglutaryl-CoA dehydratase subunit BcrC/BadD/HgdB